MVVEEISKDGRISYLAKSDSGSIACFMPDRKGANYCVNISQTICQYSLSIVYTMVNRQSVHCWSQPINDPRLALMYVEVLFTQCMLHRNTQMRNLS